jgi:hypothetical protein
MLTVTMIFRHPQKGERRVIRPYQVQAMKSQRGVMKHNGWRLLAVETPDGRTPAWVASMLPGRLDA